MAEGRKISFYSDAAHNYMVLECPPELRENYQYKMLAANRIKGLLSCSGRTIDTRQYLYYDISSRQSLKDLYDRRQVRSRDLRRILEDLLHAEETLAEYLLDTSHLILDPACIYLDFREQECCFAYYPGQEQEQGPEVLFSFLADRVDGRDKQAAALIYRLCMMAEKPGFYLRAQMLEDLGLQVDGDSRNAGEQYGREYPPAYRPDFEEAHAPERIQASVFPEYMYSVSGEEETRDAGSSGENRDSGESPGKGLWIPVLAAAAAAAGIVLLAAGLLLELEESRLLLTEALGGSLTVVGAVILITYFFRRGNRQRKLKTETTVAASCTEPEPWESSAAYYPPRPYSGAGITPYASEGQNKVLLQPLRPSVPPGETCLLSPDTRPAAGLYGTGSSRGEQISLSRLPCVVGKMQDYVDQVLDDSSVSRMHARFSLDRDGTMTVRDLNSSNGTWLNGERLQPNESRSLQQGDHVRFGRMEFIFR